MQIALVHEEDPSAWLSRAQRERPVKALGRALLLSALARALGPAQPVTIRRAQQAS